MLNNPRFNIYLLVLLIGALYGLKNLKRLSPQMKLIVYYLIIVFVSELFSRYLKYKINNTMLAYHILIPFQFIFNGYLYSTLIQKKRNHIFFFTLLFSLLSVLNSISIQPYTTYPTLSFLLLLLFNVSLILYHFSILSRFHIARKITQIPMFWINISGLIFYSLSIFYFGFKNIFNLGNPLYHWFLYFLTLLMYLFYIYSLSLDSRTSKKTKIL